jgi:hypothetical protein
MGRSRGGDRGGFRLSIAGLMTLVGVVAFDCAILIHAASAWDQLAPSAMAVFLIVGVLPLINGAGIVMLLLLQPPTRR